MWKNVMKSLPPLNYVESNLGTIEVDILIGAEHYEFLLEESRIFIEDWLYKILNLDICSQVHAPAHY